MNILLDTQALILAGRDQLPHSARAAYVSGENDVYFSLASLWEIGIKAALGKLKFKRRISDFYSLLVEDLGLLPLPIDAVHIEKAVSFPFHHKDPFDRLLAGQAIAERLVILSGDAHFDLYGCKRIWE